jgi:hypothetical protein
MEAPGLLFRPGRRGRLRTARGTRRASPLRGAGAVAAERGHAHAPRPAPHVPRPTPHAPRLTPHAPRPTCTRTRSSRRDAEWSSQDIPATGSGSSPRQRCRLRRTRCGSTPSAAACSTDGLPAADQSTTWTRSASRRRAVRCRFSRSRIARRTSRAMRVAQAAHLARPGGAPEPPAPFTDTPMCELAHFSAAHSLHRGPRVPSATGSPGAAPATGRAPCQEVRPCNDS